MMARSRATRRRKSIRLAGYDYSRPGAYFVTVSTRRQEPLFGEVIDGGMRLNALGEIVREEWFRSAQMRCEIELQPDEFVVMPNHIHGIVRIVDDGRTTPPRSKAHGHAPNVGATGRSPLPMDNAPRGPAPQSLGSFIAGFKSSATKRINHLRGIPGARVWQRNYWEHIIRDERVLHVICRYIHDNPLRWHLDRYNPDRESSDPLAAEAWSLMRG